MQKRSISLDFIRALAIIFILVTHGAGYLVNNQMVQIFSPYFASFGVGLFVFLSGYVMYLSNKSFASNKEILIFYKKRILRIFPLYWIALLVFIIIFGVLMPIFAKSFVYSTDVMNFGVYNIIVHSLGLQILLSPAYATPILTLYYVGLIVVFYLIYPFLIRFSNNIQEFFLISMVPLIGFIVIRFFFNVIDDYFFKYYLIFILGIFYCYTVSSDNKNIKKFLILIPIIMGFSLIFDIRNISNPYFGNSAIISDVINFAAFDIVVISFCLIQFEFSNLFIDDCTMKFKNLISNIAFSSYAIYLFHRPILTVFFGIAYFAGVPPAIRDLIIVLIAIPSIFIISYYIQTLEGKFIRKIL